MESFKPVVGQTYTLQDMTTFFEGKFIGFAERCREAEIEPGGRKIRVPSGVDEHLLVFETIQNPRLPRHKYAGARVRAYHDPYHQKVSFTLSASHFGDTIEDLAPHGMHFRYVWKMAE